MVVLLSKPHDFVKEPEGHKFLYTLMCRKYPKAIEDMNNRHIMYKQCQDTLFALEKAGKAFIFAPVDPPKVSTYTMDAEVNKKLYDMGISDFERLRNDFEKFMTS